MKNIQFTSFPILMDKQVKIPYMMVCTHCSVMSMTKSNSQVRIMKTRPEQKTMNELKKEVLELLFFAYIFYV